MTSWSAGYVSDIEYTARFYSELSPAYLQFICLTQGVRPPALDERSTYCELGCGQGLGTAILAALNPQMKFWGIDFNPAQIANARRLASEAGLKNISFLDHSFEQVLNLAHGELPQFDFVTIHGVYSWVSPENRRIIVRLLDKFVKPGGVVMISYNCLPGWAVDAPLQRLVREFARQHVDRSDQQAISALQFSGKMAQAKAQFFTLNPQLATKLTELAGANSAYLAHEYLNAHWAPVYHADVARELEGARLNFVGSANMLDNVDRLSIPADMLPIVLEAKDPIWRETLRDFSRNQRFRRDVFMRGASYMKPVEHSERIGSVQLAMLVDRTTASHVFKMATGEIKGKESIYRPILDALADGPRTVGELVTSSPEGVTAALSIVEAIKVLVNFHQIHPVPRIDHDTAKIHSQALNKAIAQRVRQGEIFDHVAAPLVGTATLMSYVELIALLAVIEGAVLEPATAAEFAWSVMERSGQRMLRDGVKLQDRKGNITELQTHFSQIFAKKLPLWRSLGVI